MTKDVRRLAAFYRELFGIESDDPENDVHQEMASQALGTGFAIYNDGQVPDTERGDVCLMFDVEDVDAAYERLQKLGATIEEPPTTRPWGLRSMHFRDPDGNRLTFRSLPKA